MMPKEAEWRYDMESENDTKTSTPVYVPYATLISSLENLRTHGIPGTGKIDKSIWDTQSGAIQGQLLIAFRFLGLIDDHNRVLPPLPLLVKASPEERKIQLKKIVEEKYKSVVSLDLNTISQGQLEEAFRGLKVSGSTLERAMRFFVKACQECGIPISKRISERVRGSVSQAPRKHKPSNGVKRQGEEFHATPPVAVPPTALEDKLLEKFPPFDPSWPDALKTKWFEGFERLMKSSLGEKS
jgi:hypothetical protein